MAFSRIVGHRRSLELLSRSVANRTLPPSLILAGPEGVGKRLTATSIAQALNCPSSVTGCGSCDVCRRIERGMHPDVQAIIPGETGSIKVDQIREAIERTMYRPFEGQRRVTIVDDAHTVVSPAQNALLKTLEEPTASSVFILVTSRPDSLLATVRSRCSQIRFGRLSSADIAAVLERDHKYAKREALAVAAVSDGSVGRALNAQADDFSDARSDAEALLRSARGRSDARARVERAKDLVKGGGGPTSSEREYLGLRLQTLSSLARDLGLLASGASAELLANADLREELNALATSFDSERALAVFAAVDSAQNALDRNVSPKVVADWLALQV